MAHSLVTQVSQDQDPAKAAELARLQAAELAKKNKLLPLLNRNQNQKKMIKITQAAAGNTFVAAFGDRNPPRNRQQHLQPLTILLNQQPLQWIPLLLVQAKLLLLVLKIKSS